MQVIHPKIRIDQINYDMTFENMKISDDNRPTLTRINSRSVRFLLRRDLNPAPFRSDVSTEENHMSLDKKFYGKYRHLRKTLDFSYHRNYTEKRQRLQDSIIDDMLDTALITDVNGDVCTTPTEPWLVFTAGAMGAGKGYTIKSLVSKKRFPLLAFVTVDPDEIRRLFPEYDIYVKTNPLKAGELTRKEAGMVSEILTLAALEKGKNVLVDGSLRDSNWYQGYFSSLRNDYPLLKIGIIHVTAPREAIIERAEERGILTGRVIPPELLEAAIEQVPKSVKVLGPLADYFCELNNPPDEEISILTANETWDTFQSRWLQTCAWVPGRRKQMLKELKEELNLEDNSSFIRIPRKGSFTMEEKKQASSRALGICPKRINIFASFTTNISTEDNYRSSDMKFFGSYTHIRKMLDYNYHSNYCKKRQWLQDSVIEDILMGATGFDINGVEGDTPTRPWIIYTAGAKGAGKRYAMNTMLDDGTLPLVGFVAVDPDEIRNHLPEYVLYLHDEKEKADDLTRKEVRYITELTTLAALHSGKNIIVDGALKDTEWYKNFFQSIREEFSNYRIAILHVSAPKELIYERAEALGKETGKTIPRELLDQLIVSVPKACKTLQPYVDFFCELRNPKGDFEIVTEGIDWDSFKQNWQQEVAWERPITKNVFIPSR